jgi:hypothetical protein
LLGESLWLAIDLTVFPSLPTGERAVLLSRLSVAKSVWECPRDFPHVALTEGCWESWLEEKFLRVTAPGTELGVCRVWQFVKFDGGP